MSEDSHLYTEFLETLDPQQRLNMALAFHVDELAERVAKLGDDVVSEELLDILGQDVVKMQEEIAELRRELHVLRGALDETITQLREVEAQHLPPTPEEMDEERLDDLAKVNDLLRDEVAEVRREMKIQRGALDETITQLREVEAQHLPPTPEEILDAVRAHQSKVDSDAVREAQSKAGFTPTGKRSRAKRFRGIYCRHCGKRLEGKHQSVFCSRKCGAIWRGQHPNDVATPRLSLKDDFDATVVAGVGVRE